MAVAAVAALVEVVAVMAETELNEIQIKCLELLSAKWGEFLIPYREELLNAGVPAEDFRWGVHLPDEDFYMAMISGVDTLFDLEIRPLSGGLSKGDHPALKRLIDS